MKAAVIHNFGAPDVLIETYLCAAKAVLAGRLQIPVAKTLPLSAAADAHALVAKGSIGKNLLKP